MKSAARNIKKRLTVNFLLIAFAFISSGAVVIACYKAPVTGRSQFIILSQSEESQMGLAAFQEVLKTEQVSKNAQYNEAVTRVGMRIVGVADTPHYNWDFKVLNDDEQINAFALPGGKVGVYTGILPVAMNDAGLATVMAHEIGHVAARHGAERVSTDVLAQIGAVGLSTALGGSDPWVTAAVMQAYGVGVTVGGILPFSRTQEAEADHIGLIYMAEAGYDPREAIAFWERMDAAVKGKPQPPEFLSTHPGYGTRISNLKKWLPEALPHYEQSKKAPNNTIVK